MRYNVSYDPLGTVPNAPLASDPGEELQPTILSMILMHGGHIKRGERHFRLKNPKLIQLYLYFIVAYISHSLL